MQVLKPRVGYTDLQQWPEDGRRYELYDGEVWVVPSPLPFHQWIGKELLLILDEYARTHGGLALGPPLDIVFSEFNVLQPDVVFFTAERADLVRPDRPVREAPDLVAEVLSPTTAAIDRQKKMQVYVRFRVPEYWIVDPNERRVEVYRLAGERYGLALAATGDEIAQSPLLPDLQFPASRLFHWPER